MSAAALLTTQPRRPDPRRIGPLVAAVVAAHALLLAWPRHAPVASGMPSAWAPAVQVRIVEPRREDAAADVAPAARVAVAPARASRTDAAPLPLTEPLLQVAAEEVSRDVPAVPPLPPAATWLGLALPGVPTEDDQFFARSLLSVAPAPLQPVLIDYPVFAGDAGRYVSELSLFIDETGTVVKVRVDGAPLPPPLEAAARHAFLNARFRPGEAPEVGVVKSRIRVEVTFDSRGLGASDG